MKKALTVTVALTALMITGLGSMAQPGTDGRRNEAGSNEAGQVRRGESGPGRRNVGGAESRPSAAQNERGRQELSRTQSQRETAGRGRLEKQDATSGRDSGRNLSRQSGAPANVAEERNVRDRNRNRQDVGRGRVEESGNLARERNVGDRNRDRQEVGRNRLGESGNVARERNAGDRNRDRQEAGRNRVGESGNLARERNVGDRTRERQDVGRNREPTVGRGETTTRERGSITLTDQQRTRVSEMVRRMNVQPLPRSRISVSVGARVPRSIQLHSIPREVLAIYPQFRSYRFVLVEDEIVVVDPRTYTIVTVVPTSGRGFAARSTDFVANGHPYCFYFDGWHGAGWYRCGFAQRTGLGWGGVYGWHGWVYEPAERRFGVATRGGRFPEGGTRFREGASTRESTRLRERANIREGTRERGATGRARIGETGRGTVGQDNATRRSGVGAQGPSARTEGRGGENESNRRGAAPSSQRGGPSGEGPR